MLKALSILQMSASVSVANGAQTQALNTAWPNAFRSLNTWKRKCFRLKNGHPMPRLGKQKPADNLLASLPREPFITGLIKVCAKLKIWICC